MQAKVTSALDADLLKQVKAHVLAGGAKSQSEFVESALPAQLRQIKQDARERSLEAVSKDPMYLADRILPRRALLWRCDPAPTPPTSPPSP